jgi:hypothetical protein
LSELFSDMLYRRNKSSSHNQQVLVVAVWVHKIQVVLALQEVLH